MPKQENSLPAGERKRQSPFFNVEVLKEVVRPNQWVIEPNNKNNMRFDIVICLALCFTAIVTPYEVAILSTRLNPRFYVKCFVDFLYLIGSVLIQLTKCTQ
jgi:hypothetical protein